MFTSVTLKEVTSAVSSVIFVPWRIRYVLASTYLRVNRKMFYVATEVIVKVTGNHIHCKSGSVLEMVQD